MMKIQMSTCLKNRKRNTLILMDMDTDPALREGEEAED